MTGQFDKQINTHQAKDWSNYRVFCSHATTEVRSDDCTRVYTPKTCHSFHGKLTLSEPGTYFCYPCCLPPWARNHSHTDFHSSRATTHLGHSPHLSPHMSLFSFKYLSISFLKAAILLCLILQYFSLFNTSIASARLLCCLLSGSSTILITICKQSLIL